MRLFVGNGGPNLVSSFHVIGEIFDKVRYEGGTHFQENVQTTLIPAGGAAIVEFHTEVPGSYVLVDHSIFRAFNKGALAILKVDGRGEQGDLLGQGSRLGVPRRQAPAEPDAGRDGGARRRGERHADQGTSRSRPASALFTGTCSVCHQAERRRARRACSRRWPKSDYLLADTAARHRRSCSTA